MRAQPKFDGTVVNTQTNARGGRHQNRRATTAATYVYAGEELELEGRAKIRVNGNKYASQGVTKAMAHDTCNRPSLQEKCQKAVGKGGKCGPDAGPAVGAFPGVLPGRRQTVKQKERAKANARALQQQFRDNEVMFAKERAADRARVSEEKRIADAVGEDFKQGQMRINMGEHGDTKSEDQMRSLGSGSTRSSQVYRRPSMSSRSSRSSASLSRSSRGYSEGSRSGSSMYSSRSASSLGSSYYSGSRSTSYLYSSRSSRSSRSSLQYAESDAGLSGVDLDSVSIDMIAPSYGRHSLMRETGGRERGAGKPAIRDNSQAMPNKRKSLIEGKNLDAHGGVYRGYNPITGAAHDVCDDTGQVALQKNKGFTRDSWDHTPHVDPNAPCAGRKAVPALDVERHGKQHIKGRKR